MTTQLTQDDYDRYFGMPTPSEQAQDAIRHQHKVFAHLLRATFARHDAETQFNSDPDTNVFKWCAALKAEAKFKDALRHADIAVGTNGASLENAYVRFREASDAKQCAAVWEDAKSQLPSFLVSQRLAQLRVSVSRRLRKDASLDAQ